MADAVVSPTADTDTLVTSYQVFPTGWDGGRLRLEDHWSVTVKRFFNGRWMVCRGVTHWSPSSDDGAGAWVKTTFYGRSPAEDCWLGREDALVLGRRIANTHTFRGRTYAQAAAERT